MTPASIAGAVGSPVSDDGRGLKLDQVTGIRPGDDGSPVSDDGRGLKHGVGADQRRLVGVRPSVMTGVD